MILENYYALFDNIVRHERGRSLSEMIRASNTRLRIYYKLKETRNGSWERERERKRKTSSKDYLCTSSRDSFHCNGSQVRSQLRAKGKMFLFSPLISLLKALFLPQEEASAFSV